MWNYSTASMLNTKLYHNLLPRGLLYFWQTRGLQRGRPCIRASTTGPYISAQTSERAAWPLPGCKTVIQPNMSNTAQMPRLDGNLHIQSISWENMGMRLPRRILPTHRGEPDPTYIQPACTLDKTLTAFHSTPFHRTLSTSPPPQTPFRRSPAWRIADLSPMHLDQLTGNSSHAASRRRWLFALCFADLGKSLPNIARTPSSGNPLRPPKWRMDPVQGASPLPHWRWCDLSGGRTLWPHFLSTQP